MVLVPDDKNSGGAMGMNIVSIPTGFLHVDLMAESNESTSIKRKTFSSKLSRPATSSMNSFMFFSSFKPVVVLLPLPELGESLTLTSNWP